MNRAFLILLVAFSLCLPKNVFSSPLTCFGSSADVKDMVVYVPKRAEEATWIQMLLSAGFRVTTESSAKRHFESLKKNSWKDCIDDRCNIAWGKALAATYMLDVCADKSKAYLWDLKSETIICVLEKETPTGNKKLSSNISVKEIMEGTTLYPGMSYEEVIQIVGAPDKKGESRTDKFKYPEGPPHTYLGWDNNKICKTKKRLGVGGCCLQFTYGKLDHCFATRFGICSLSMTSD